MEKIKQAAQTRPILVRERDEIQYFLQRHCNDVASSIKTDVFTEKNARFAYLEYRIAAIDRRIPELAVLIGDIVLKGAKCASH